MIDGSSLDIAWTLHTKGTGTFAEKESIRRKKTQLYDQADNQAFRHGFARSIVQTLSIYNENSTQPSVLSNLTSIPSHLRGLEVCVLRRSRTKTRHIAEVHNRCFP